MTEDFYAVVWQELCLDFNLLIKKKQPSSSAALVLAVSSPN